MPPHQLRCEEIVDLLQITHADDIIGQYAAAMRAGERFPPISVIRIGRRFYLADGHKRLAALRSIGIERVEVEVWTRRQWFADQWRQAKGNAVKNARILMLLPREPRKAFWLAGTTLRHWARVARSLASRAAGAQR